MKKPLLIAIILLCTIESFSQFSHTPILIGKPIDSINTFFNKINSLKPYYQLKDDIATDGNDMIICIFDARDEYYYKCMEMTLFFIKIGNIDVCDKELITGTTDYAKDNLDYIKDNFDYVSVNEWRQPYKNGAHLQIEAFFNRPDYSSNFCAISYIMQSTKP